MSKKSASPSFPGNTAIHALIQSHDWTTSPLGPPANWPQALRAICSMMLDSKIPMVVVWGPERVLLYNESYVQFLGEKHPAQAFGLPVWQVWPEIWGDIGPLIERAAAGDAFYIEDLPLTIRRHGQDEAAWFTFSYSPVRDDTGALYGMCSAVMETTSRVLAEKRQAELAHSLEERVAMRTAELERAQARQGFQLHVADVLRGMSEPSRIFSRICEMLGRHLHLSRVLFGDYDIENGLVTYHSNYTDGSAKELTGTYPVASFGADNFASLENGTTWIAEDMSRDPRTAQSETWPTFASLAIHAAVVVPLSRHGTLMACLFVSDSKPRRWTDDEVTLIQDIAERTWTAIERVRAEEALKEAGQRKDRFLAMLAHELRNPLAPISAAAHLLKIAGTDAERIQRASEIIVRQVDHMTGLVDDLLDVSRVTRGLVTLDKEEIDLKRVISDAVEQVRPLIEARRHHLSVNTAPDTAVVLGDYKRLVQVLANLLNNAAKYTPDGGNILVRMEATDAQVVVQVADDGIGMPADLLPHVFKLFAQAERAPDRSQGGLGLGLALVKNLVELHGGNVTAASKGPGTGSKFVVRLPRLMKEVGAQSATESSAANKQVAVTPLRLLIVDDNVDAAQMLAMYLEAAGHDVLVEFSPSGALERARHEAFDACLLDIGLPGMDGNELARHLRAMPTTKGALFIAITGYGQQFDRETAIASGFDHYFVKPADPVKLAAVLALAKKGANLG